MKEGAPPTSTPINIYSAVFYRDSCRLLIGINPQVPPCSKICGTRRIASGTDIIPPATATIPPTKLQLRLLQEQRPAIKKPRLLPKITTRPKTKV